MSIDIKQWVCLWGILMTALMVTAIGAVPVQACSCMPPTVASSYNHSSDVIKARIFLRIQRGDSVVYFANVQHVFKGCLSTDRYVILRTPSSSAACGITLRTGDEYLINGNASGTYWGFTQLSVGLCDYNPLFSALSDEDLDFLYSRLVCCSDACICADGSRPVNCFVDPCEVAPDCPDGKCQANYCGGCTAEFYDANGYAVCENKCQDDADCPEDQYCASDHMCEDDGRCERDVDCNLLGNVFLHIQCVGYGVCDSFMCGWVCGLPQCVDVAGYDFGACEMILGWGVIDGRCTLVSGCGSDGFYFFATEKECQTACGG
ncbi:MAG: hypothetical protein HKP58_13730 [Desulfatitalea sp.]|nr:hypothetical protein [Desulfatitalea sp.]NNK01462.1 hypothetical protein [Desulfatitalea sp.]